MCACNCVCAYVRVCVCVCVTPLNQMGSLEEQNACTATHCIALHHTALHCTTLQRTATHCNALQRTATHCNTPGGLTRRAKHGPHNTRLHHSCRKLLQVSRENPKKPRDHELHGPGLILFVFYSTITRGLRCIVSHDTYVVRETHM